MKTLQIEDELHREYKITVAIFGGLMIEATAEAIRAWIDDKTRQPMPREQEQEEQDDVL